METLKIVKILKGNPKFERRLTVQTAEGRVFCAKNRKCPKRQETMNSVWLANEVVYYGFARSAGLWVPDAAILLWDDEALFGSEKHNGRVELKNEDALLRIVERHPENRIQLTKALLLDLALLNCDREASAILVDKEDYLWFIDHDKSLWGDGMEEHNFTPKPGDLGRIDVSKLPKASDNFIGDYLQFQTANAIVWDQDVATITGAFQSLPLNQEMFHSSCSAIPQEWLPQTLVPRMEEFLKVWWDELKQLFDCADFQKQISLT